MIEEFVLPFTGFNCQCLNLAFLPLSHDPVEVSKGLLFCEAMSLGKYDRLAVIKFSGCHPEQGSHSFFVVGCVILNFLDSAFDLLRFVRLFQGKNTCSNEWLLEESSSVATLMVGAIPLVRANHEFIPRTICDPHHPVCFLIAENWTRDLLSHGGQTLLD